VIGITHGQSAASALDAFERAIDRGCPADRSVVLRYRDVCRLSEDAAVDQKLKAQLARTSLAEGLRVIRLLTYRGVEIEILDATSLMASRTHKSIDGCVTTAHCTLAGHRRIVFESGGNTGTALTLYASSAGLETFLFLPAENLRLLDAAVYARPGVHVFAVEDAAAVKPAAAAFAAREGIPRVPQKGWRQQASSFVGCFVLEHLLGHARPTHFVQGISAAFAPIGIYRMLEPFRERLGGLPAFLGVQQAANCPMYRAWRGDDIAEIPLPSSTTALLAPVMYDGAPRTYGTFDDLEALLHRNGGDLTTIDRAAFERWLSLDVEGRSPVEHLASARINIAARDGDIVEKAGLMGLAAAFREIAAGRFAAGSRLLVSITGGTAQPHGDVTPERVIASGEDCA
jgi:threonine synthase